VGKGWHTFADVAIILAIIAGIRLFRTPRRARAANLITALALLCAVGLVLSRHSCSAPILVMAALAMGTLAGWLVAMRVGMIHVPALVGFQNGAGGAAAFLVSFVELQRGGHLLPGVSRVGGILGLIVGAVTFSGSLIAGAKLSNLLRQTPLVLPGHDRVLLGLLAGVVATGALAGAATGTALLFSLLVLLLVSLMLGVVFSVRVGGADMPVTISFLNALTGLAAAFCGIVTQNRLLIAAGATVGASGSILTYAMCRAMNRNLLKVFLGVSAKPTAPEPPCAPEAEGEPETGGRESPIEEEAEKPSLPPLERAAEAARKAGKVVIIPGYGMALAQAQFELERLAGKLEEMGKEVKFAIHPVAGRMPGHMNVLLAEAGTGYDKLFEMDEINPEFRETDLALVVGACDVVNPAAIRAEGTPISGMPILMAHEARHVIVCNLDREPGYSGVENPLYDEPKAILLLGDAKDTVGQLLRGLG